jgi:hypothetical protein
MIFSLVADKMFSSTIFHRASISGARDVMVE